ncbi:hypothetical protein E1B28_001335 [Marasmius oreades]|uniref:Uncharacterized protein n=1 Tax=Marasmius oreades TaxID=181124 RepID=A0A9P7V376_9AGAR|nr:uncharacterized protein E1B28_001335 [Marasmius oreades]KAG7099488.1 hypothetical protein E1B28_001335 [Marasmius oreades]
MANNDNGVTVSSEISVGREGQGQVAVLSNVVDLTNEGAQIQNTTAPSTVASSRSTHEETEKGNTSSNNTTSSTNLATGSTGPTVDSSVPLHTKPTFIHLGSGSTVTQPKRFSAVNINKKFLEKTSNTLPTASSTSSLKTGLSTSRPNITPSTSHPRLITTKLTANPQSSSSPGPGWSRPSSVTPPAAPNSNSTTPNGTKNPAQTSSTTAANNLASVAPQLLLGGKVIQPQPRSAVHSTSIPKGNTLSGGNSNKPVWGNVKAGVSAARAISSDFPTAAEVAQGTSSRLGKSTEMKELEAASKQARLEEADTFRGVHLDPNAHHWDEMEEDDDNFLDGVIEFGDGRQYNVDTNHTHTPPSEELTPPTTSVLGVEREDRSVEISNEPVSKEERFVDDFDRSWPRTGLSSSSAATTSETFTRLPALTTQSEFSKVLFNERSNRLEPYSNTRPSQFKRVHQPDQSTTEPHVPRTSSAHTSGIQGVQVLQKLSGSDGYIHGRGYSASQASAEKRREAQHSPASPRPGSTNLPLSSSISSRTLDGEHRGRQQSVMGPPPVPSYATRDSKDASRQLPPHLSHPSLTDFASSSFDGNDRRASSRESRYSTHSGHPPTSSGPASARPSSQSPSLSHASAAAPATLSPIADPTMLHMTAAELEDVKKDLMHNAAARAKQRRQQEEEEREREKERARLKAIELEQRLAEKTRDSSGMHTQNDTAVQIIEEFITEAKEENMRSGTEKPIPPQSFRSVPSRDQPGYSRRGSFSRLAGAIPVASDVPSTTSVESWRKRPLHHTPPVTHSRNASFASQLPSALDHAQSLADDPDVELEIVDYSELGRFVGVEQPEDMKNSPIMESTEIPRRPVASDFFEEDTLTTSPGSTKLSDGKAWRMKDKAEEPGKQSSASSYDSPPTLSTAEVEAPILTHPFAREIKETTLEHPSTSLPYPTRYQRHAYKEATMSALDNAMSRVKEALDGIQAGEKEHILHAETDAFAKRTVALPGHSMSTKDLQVAQFSRPYALDPGPTENFLLTSTEPPRSPEPAWNQFQVRLPRILNVPSTPIERRQLHLFSKFDRDTRWQELLSFTPPVRGMNRKDLSLNEVLFRRDFISKFKGRPKYRVYLPKGLSSPFANNNGARPRTSLRTPAPGAFGKPTVADEASTWRKRSADASTASTLDTTSRSPPPVPSEVSIVGVSLETTKEETFKENVGAGSSRTRSQPKMPVGSGVAFYRDSQIVEVDSKSKPAVSFFANDAGMSHAVEEVETDCSTVSGVATVSSIGSKIPSIDMKRLSPSASPNQVKYNLPALVNSAKSDSKSSEDSPDRVPITPPSHHGPTWSRSSLSLPLKDSPVRAPDPEHLKAVWSQASNKSALHPVNSLEGIADDLTALPFTLLDVKSEDGETPPPTMSMAPSRMSLHDVTKAFQQVPTSSLNINSHRPTISPPSTSAPVARPPQGFNYSVPSPSAQNMRSAYPYHHSPLMSHSPAPVLFPHPMNGSPVPTRMPVNGHTPLFSPVWMPVPNAGGQPPGAMMRPSVSYPPPMYPSPAPQPLYGMPPNMQNSTSGPQQGGHVNRGRGNGSIISPVMPHAGSVSAMPMYTGSPVMMPAHPGRPPMRNENHHHPSIPQHHPSTAHHPPPPTQSYPTMAGAPSFGGVRPTW